MKKIISIGFLVFAFACNDDLVTGPAMGFYPTAVEEALEEDGIPYQVTLAATGELNNGGVVQITLDNYEFIETTPAHTDGVFEVNVSTSGTATFTIEALDDTLPNDYVSTLRITDTGGDITGIASSTFSFVVTDDDIDNLFFEDFESGLDDWEIEDVGSGNDWSTGSFSGNTYADVSNFSANGVTEAWLLSAEIDFAAGENEVLLFETQPRFNEGKEIFKAYVVTGYTPGSNPSTSTLEEIAFEIDDHTGAGFGDFVSSGSIDLSTISSTSRIAFYYKAGDASDGSGWSVDNIGIQSFDPDNSDGIPNTNTSGGNGANNGGSDSSFSLPFSDNFESCATEGQFNIPSNWFEENVPGFNTIRGWGCRNFGVDDSWAPRASAFISGDSDGEDDSWMISNGTFDLTSVTSVQLSFYSKSQYTGPGKVQVYWSSDYSGAGDPTQTTWTELTDVTTKMNAITESFTEITGDLSAAAGSEAYLAFRYTDGAGSSSIAIDIDDISITGN